MTPEEAQAKFRGLTGHEKAAALLGLIWQSTLTMRAIGTYFRTIVRSDGAWRITSRK